MKVVLKNITKIFKNRIKGLPDTIALKNIDVEIPDGKLIALLGPSGCGKSTCLNIISGLEDPTEGRVFFGDEDVTDLPAERRGVGLVFQNYALYPHLTALDNIIFPLQNLKKNERISKEEMLKKAHEVAKLVQIEEYLDHKPSELSGGQQQRVAIARALIKMPKVLLLDEPLSNLDARLRLQTREEIKRIQNETGITTIFVTHDQEEAMSISDEIVVMKKALIQQKGQPQDVYDNPCNLFVAQFLGTPAINVFKGEIKDGYVVINSEKILERKDLKNQEVYVGIRPEGFIVKKNGKFTCGLKNVEVMGRDKSCVLTHISSTQPTLRAIISSDDQFDEKADTIKFDLKENKVFVFNKETEERI